MQGSSVFFENGWRFAGVTPDNKVVMNKGNNLYVAYDKDNCYLFENGAWRLSTFEEIDRLSSMVYPVIPSAPPPIEEDSRALAHKVNGIQEKILKAMLEVDKEIRGGLFGKKGQVLSTKEIDKKFVSILKKILDPLLGKDGGLGFDYQIEFTEDTVGVQFFKIGKVGTSNEWITFSSSIGVLTSDVTSIATGLQYLVNEAMQNGGGNKPIDTQKLKAMGSSLSGALRLVQQARESIQQAHVSIAEAQKNLSESKTQEEEARKHLMMGYRLLATGAVLFGLGIVGVCVLATGALVLPWYFAGTAGLASLASIGLGGLFVFVTLVSSNSYENLSHADRNWSYAKRDLESKMGKSFQAIVGNDKLYEILAEVSKQMPGNKEFLRETGYRKMLENLSDPATAKKHITHITYLLLEDGFIRCDKLNSTQDLRNAIDGSLYKDTPLMQAVLKNLDSVDIEFLKEYQFLKQQYGNKEVDAMRLHKLDYVSKHLNEFQGAFKEIRNTMVANSQSTASSLSSHKFTFSISKQSGVTVQDLLNRIDFENQQEHGRNNTNSRN